MGREQKGFLFLETNRDDLTLYWLWVKRALVRPINTHMQIVVGRTI